MRTIAYVQDVTLAAQPHLVEQKGTRAKGQRKFAVINFPPHILGSPLGHPAPDKHHAYIVACNESRLLQSRGPADLASLLVSGLAYGK